MTAWAFVILEQMGFDRLESLSLASTFTSVTSTQHALNLGNVYTPEQKRDAELEMAQLPRDYSASEIPGSTTWDDGKRRRIGFEAAAGTPESRGGNAQPWVTVMRRKLPVIQLTDKTWRGLSRGAAVDPDQVGGESVLPLFLYKKTHTSQGYTPNRHTSTLLGIFKKPHRI